MSIILNRLKQSFDILIESHQSNLTIGPYLNSLSAGKRAELVSHHAQLNIEYDILCSKIAYALETNADVFELREQMKEALKTAVLLEIIYRDYLNTPREKDRLKREQQALLQWLHLDPNEPETLKEKTYFEQWIRDYTNYFNLPRVCMVRFRKLILALAPFIESESLYNQTLQPVDHYMAMFLTNLACFYFLPRLIDNIAMTVKHTFEYRGMTDEEKALGWKNRLSIQLNLRWVELTSDLLWLIDNIMSMAILVGPLLPFNILFSMCMQLIDITQACIQKNVVINGLYQQRDEYIKCRDALCHDANEYEQMNDFIEHLDKRIHYESNMSLIPIINSTILLCALILAIPTLAPGCAVASGIIAVSVTVGSYYGKQHIEAQKPPNNLFNLLESTPSHTGFFSRREESPHHPDHRYGQDDAKELHFGF